MTTVSHTWAISSGVVTCLDMALSSSMTRSTATMTPAKGKHHTCHVTQPNHRVVTIPVDVTTSKAGGGHLHNPLQCSNNYTVYNTFYTGASLW